MFNKTQFKVALVRKNLPACGLAHLLGIDRATMSRIVNGWQVPSSPLKKKIAEFLELNEVDLWQETQPNKSQEDESLGLKRHEIFDNPLIEMQRRIDVASSKEELESLRKELCSMVDFMKGPIKPEHKPISDMIDIIEIKLQGL